MLDPLDEGHFDPSDEGHLPAQLNERIRKRDTKLGLRSGLEERWT